MTRERKPGELADAVQDRLQTETESAGCDVHVDGRQHGVVRLHGIVDTLSQAEAATQIARQEPGVSHVTNDLTVHREPGRGDGDMRHALSERLARNPRTEGVGAEVAKGSVTLYGEVDTNADRDEAVRLAKGVAGVKAVTSKLRVGVGRDDDDAAVARTARRLLAQMGFDPGHFTLWCDAGTLHIRGLVRSKDAAGTLKRMLGRLDGVAKVNAFLPVDPDATAGDAPEDVPIDRPESGGGPAAEPESGPKAAMRHGVAPDMGHGMLVSDVPDDGNVLGNPAAPGQP